jgi:ankyrin repeat protein
VRRTVDTAAVTTELFDAIAAGDVERVRRAVAAGASPDARHSYTMHERFEEPYEVQETALFAALNWKRLEVALELLALGANPHEGGNGYPLVVAVERGLGAAVAAILARSPAKDALAQGLLAAATGGSSELGAQIIDAGAEPTVRALCLACSRGAQALALRVLDAGVDVNALDGGSSPLTQAAWSGNVELVHALVARGANLARDGGQALFSAANAGRTEALAALLAYGVPADVPDAHGWTALMTAAWQDQPEVARVLLHAGANREHRDARGRTVLDWARESRQRSVVALLEGWQR